MLSESRLIGPQDHPICHRRLLMRPNHPHPHHHLQDFQSTQRPLDQVQAEDDDLESSSDARSEDQLPAYPSIAERIAGGSSSLPADISLSQNPEVESLYQSNHNASSPTTPPARPNKFRGPASTWRNWTASERGLAASLDQLRAKDLSVHLYNAYKLKQRSKKRSFNDLIALESPTPGELEIDEIDSWKPPKTWTAWPLSSGDVPREDDEKRWEEGYPLRTAQSTTGSRPSSLLKELLVAQIARHARERFTQRESSGPSSTIETSEQASKLKLPAKAPDYDAQYDRSKRYTPVVLADDERASQILQPTVQHILTKLDDLLRSLHRSRTYYFDVGDSESESQSQARRSTSRARSRKRKGSVLMRDASALDSSEESMANGQTSRRGSTRRAASRSRSKSVPTPKSIKMRKSRLGLRGWSDVLAMASLSGWDSDVVEAAASRCASLFDEGILFRTLDEGDKQFEERGYIASTPTGQTATPLPSESQDHDDDGEDDIFGGVHVDGYLQPITAKKSWKYPVKKRKLKSTSRKPRPGF